MGQEAGSTPAEGVSLGSLALISLTVLGNWLLDMVKRRQSDEGGTTMEERSDLLQVVVSSLAGSVLLPTAERTATATLTATTATEAHHGRPSGTA